MKSKSTQKGEYSSKFISEIKSYNKNIHLVKKKILAVWITNAKRDKILEYIFTSLTNSTKNYYIVTPNPEMLVYAASHPSFSSILNNAELALCDGVGVYWGAQVLKNPLTERFTGVELVEKVCEKASKQLIRIGFLGGRPGVAEKAVECLTQKYPGLTVTYVSDGREEGYPEQKEDKGEGGQVSSRVDGHTHPLKTTRHSISDIPPLDILFVAFGFPKQEEWMAQHLNKIPVRVMVGVGGAFDFLSGRVWRAPKWVQNVGLEWLFRLVIQPWRLKRQLALPKFAWMVLRERFSQK